MKTAGNRLARWRAVLTRGAVTAALLGVPACAYFNSLYNAQRLFDDARRAESRGDFGTAYFNYGSSIEKAAKSYRQSPDGRWADDALYLIGRAHFGRGDDAEARAALLRVRERTGAGDIRAGASAYLGAVELRTGHPLDAVRYLDEAVAGLRDGEVASFARLWRARARFGSGDPAQAWEDLEQAAEAKGLIGQQARLEVATRAIEGDDRGRAVVAFEALLREREAARWEDTLQALARVASRRWGTGDARTLLGTASRANWPMESRQRLTLLAAELAAHSGQVELALEEARSLAGSAQGRTADLARVAYARWRLESATGFGELDDARAMLRPAIGSMEARELLHSVQVLTVLLERGYGGQSVAFIAAGEIARDVLNSPVLARLLFTAYADAAPDGDWAPKALLAAVALEPTGEEADRLRRRLLDYEENIYVAALQGRDAGAREQFNTIEDRLARVLRAIVENAEREAQRSDMAVVSATTVIDSLRAAARADSLLVICALFVDSLRISGIRADSVRAACQRDEGSRLDSLLRVDTLLLRDTTRVRSDSMPPAGLPPGPGNRIPL